MMQAFAQILIMLLAINAAPILAARLFEPVGDLPLDLGKRLRDGRSLFGPSKTWRGLVFALLAACLLSLLFGHGLRFGLVFGGLVMAGDLLSSFVKRRRGLASSDQSLGWDQVPESLFPSIYAVVVLDMPWWWAVVSCLAFMVIELFISKPLFRLKIRKRPY